MVTIHKVEQGTDEWEKLRRGLYTGSNAHKLLKFGAINYSKSQDSSFTGNFFTQRGHTLEVEAIELYEQIYECRVQRPGFVTNDLYHGCGYSPDGIDGSCGRDGILGILLEVKCFNKTRHTAIAKGEIPLEILAQIHFGMLICNIRKARLILYNPDFAKESDDDYDPDLALTILEIKFSRNIQSNFKRRLKETSNAVHPQTTHA